MRATITIYENWPSGPWETADVGEAATMDEAAQIVRECGYRVRSVGAALGGGEQAGEIVGFHVFVDPPGEPSEEPASRPTAPPRPKRLQAPIRAPRYRVLYLKEGREHGTAWFHHRDHAQRALAAMQRRFGERNAIIYVD